MAIQEGLCSCLLNQRSGVSSNQLVYYYDMTSHRFFVHSQPFSLLHEIFYCVRVISESDRRGVALTDVARVLCGVFRRRR
jgi:hypothetical protein